MNHRRVRRVNKWEAWVHLFLSVLYREFCVTSCLSSCLDTPEMVDCDPEVNCKLNKPFLPYVGFGWGYSFTAKVMDQEDSVEVKEKQLKRYLIYLMFYEIQRNSTRTEVG